MSTAQKLTKQSEEKLLDALGEVRELLDSGTAPTEAVIKVASSRQVPAGHIQLMVNAVNTGLTNEKRTSADDLYKKAEEFPLAAASQIMNRLYPETIKTAAEVWRESVVSNDYGCKPERVLVPTVNMVKQAAAKPLPPLTDKLVPINERYSDLPSVAIQKAYTVVKEAKRGAEESRMHAQRYFDRCIKTAQDVGDYFMRPGGITFDEVSYNARSLFGKQASVLLDLIKSRLQKSVYEKKANYRLRPVDINAAPYSLIRTAIEQGREYLEKKAAYQEALKHSLEVADKAMRPFARGPLLGGSVLGPSSVEKIAGPFGDFMSGAFRGFGAQAAVKGFGQKFPGSIPESESQETGDLQKLMDPAHETEIRNIQAEAMLNDLMANDEVISGYDPSEVTDAYNEVSQISPRSANQKAIMRDMIRKRLAGGAGALDSFSLDSLAGMENKLKTRDAPERGHTEILKGTGVLKNEKQSSVLD